MIDKHTIGQKIKEFRQRANLSQLQLEVEIGASPGSLSRLESGKINPTKETIYKISKVLNLAPEETALLFGIELNKVEEEKFENYEKLRNEHVSSHIDTYNLILNVNLEEILDNTVNEIIKLGYVSPAIYLKQNTSEIYSLKKAQIPNDTLEMAKEILGKDIYDIEYSFGDKTLITHAILSGELKTSDEVFEILIPNMGKFYSLQSSNNTLLVIALPIKLNSKVIGCITFQSKEANLFHDDICKLENIAEKTAHGIYTAEIKEEIDIKLGSKDRKVLVNTGLINNLSEFFTYNNIRDILKNDINMKVFLGLFIGYSMWWIIKEVFIPQNNIFNIIWGNIYFIMALFAALIGYRTSRFVGGIKNKLGTMLLVLTLIAVGHIVGQVANTLFEYLAGVKLSYPSAGELGFYSACILSAYLSIYIFRYIKGKCLVSPLNLVNTFLIVLVGLILGAIKFMVLYMNNYDWSTIGLTTIVFDISYIIGQTLAVTFSLGGLIILKKSVVCKETRFFFVLYLYSSFLLYLADMVFVYRYNLGVWIGGDIADFLYFLYYSLIAFGHVALLATIKRDVAIQKDGMQIKDYRYAVEEVVGKMVS